MAAILPAPRAHSQQLRCASHVSGNMRFAPPNPRVILTRALLPICSSPWRLFSHPRTAALSRFSSTARMEVSSPARRSPSGASIVETRGKNQTNRGANNQDRQAVKPPRSPLKRNGKATTPRQNTQRSNKIDSRQSGLHPQRKVRKAPQQPPLSLKELDELERLRIDVYNYCAKFLATPEYVRVGSRKNATVHIDFPEQDIHVKATGRLENADLQACAAFIEAANKVPDISTPPEEALSLDVSNADEFVRFYARQKRLSKYEDKSEELRGGFKSQIYCEDVPVGEVVHARRKRDAVPLAYLTAAVSLVQKEPSTLRDFRLAARGNDGKVLLALRPIDFQIVPLMLNDLEKSSRRFLTSASAQARRPSLEERIWTNPHQSRSSSTENSDLRNAELLKRHEAFLTDPLLEKVRSLKASLPMNQYRDGVLKLVNNNTFSIIVGATGSGKTTQVPQIILEDAIVGNRAASVNIICTQPRRIAAKAVATRVASERNETLMNTVGYHVKGENRTSGKPGHVTFCTTGILLKQLQSDADHVMDSTSHIIIDEVHERDLLIDFLMTTLKKLIEERQKANKRVPNVVLMSATMDTELFSSYFQQKDSNGKLKSCPSISVPGRTFPVKEKYLQTILEEFKQTYSKEDLQILEDKDTRDYLSDEVAAGHSTSVMSIQQGARNDLATDMKDAIVPVRLVAATIAHICRTTTEGAILAFLPGLPELLSTQKLLLENPLGVNFSDTSKFRIFLLHSSLKENQDEVFDSLPSGTRKIVISTNIAETSITIPDVQHVVDSGKLRENRYNQLAQITKLQCVWVSKSNMRQRAGRAGRVQNGNYYALYSSSRYDSLDTIGLPEMLRSDLIQVCLDVRAHSNHNIGEFLAASIQPPNPIAVDASVQDLKDIEALTGQEDITPLGRLLASLPVHPSLGKMIVLGVIFRCLDPLLILGASANERSLFIRPPGSYDQADRAKEAFGQGLFSDPLTTINAFREARHHIVSSGVSRDGRIPHFFTENFLHFGAFNAIDRTMREIEKLLETVGVIPATPQTDRTVPHQCGHASLNRNSGNGSLIRALVLAGHRGNIAINTGNSAGFATQKENFALIHRSSLNSFIGDKRSRRSIEKMKQVPVPPILSFGVRSLNDQNDITLRDTSLVSPLISTLFGGELRIDGNLVTVGDRLKFYAKSDGSHRSGVILKQFRRGLDTLLSNALSDLAKQKTLTDDPIRDLFANDVAWIIEHDFAVYMSTSQQRVSAMPSRGRDRGSDSGRSSDQQGRGHFRPVLVT
ncbi:P-loop containing nucleoside triphosphate hydrolase protein [Pleomassaria siparia CBS 279.74]|uniref:RNA helicase n=1 Tax=Pleomassaria siparia CBS 279.74 TaxID=1314801 RepID=A0A6G1KQX0_9PLEO|nr:P-loop containing nucleoside triphosphate hydrolase protein [Pleomassaria siparia CBS 279.74]